ncbi:probable RNA-binding protein EIF1AD [Procambarus clarkii]|uniref:probable RNA-binding protein EIF1AD n=1 Tax=Procambarus clarkii TaxID=6728 RepID=UPI001E676219|nr:probable RNA-binding protein EIF1AD [Procambarus clarkii]XP_045621163.1 probable RNA-binding protein EIF1AD [Procambarus clarkii]XP_045621164.1 probable RNA-binding protein EIF1AD [Procambarus clarkii]XP_045621165.1 probable RNA-binding protein EIF1AD [Procambarus clarkii]XP_045621166.1 probable RNA-binding protein EIF1AD [Procambarus clarkii]
MSATTKKKHVERELCEDFSLPEGHQSIVKVVRPRGNNLHQVTTANGEEFLASMPLKFRKHVWIKRGDYVVTEPIPEGNKVRAEIVRILMKDHIRYIMQNSKWPSEFVEHSEDVKEKIICGRLEGFKMSGSGESDIEGDEGDLLKENTNRQRVYVEESDSEESDSEESDSEESNSEESESKEFDIKHANDEEIHDEDS